ncbi:cytochrome P450 [Streptomyces humi]|uniref:cytochrome P450 n=1 Tax=Streptomyces humi TaxID=1428620 RepID=UPI001F0ADD67|nr:cytochrome P450 [Streptomyces humi]
MGETDLVQAFNAPPPATVIAELLGIPEEYHRDFRHWSGQALQAPVESLEWIGSGIIRGVLSLPVRHRAG